MADMGGAPTEGSNGQIEFDGETVTIYRKGLIGSLGHGKTPRALKVRAIQRVDFEEPTFTRKGYIRFAVPGEIHNDVAQDKNCVLFTKKQTAGMVAVRDQVRAAFSSRTDAEKEALRSKSTAAYQAAAPAPPKAKTAKYGGHSAQGDVYVYPEDGVQKFKGLSGASATFESGADKSRPTLTRIGAGAIIAGPVGAIAGGLFKKNTSKCYVTIEFPDGEAVIVEGPAKDETKMRQFAADVNKIAR